LLLEYSGIKTRNTGGNAANPISIVQNQSSSQITSLFNCITQLLNTVERLLVLSPQELGQPAPREISATEVTEISQSTNTVYGYISDAIDEGRAAWKKILYESLVAKGTELIEVPVVSRYSTETIEAAGFKLINPADEAVTKSQDYKQSVTGNKKALLHDYIFTSRDGGDRNINSQAAQTLTQLVSSVAGIPVVAEALGKTKLFNIINEIFRLSGAGYDLKLEVEPGQDDSINAQQDTAIKQLSEQVAQLEQQMQMIAQAAAQQSQGGAPAIPMAPPQIATEAPPTQATPAPYPAGSPLPPI
jgi:hypothetical protein